jgi:PAS domain S-box-containing protein
MQALLSAYSGGLVVVGLLQLTIALRNRQGLQWAMALCCLSLIPYLQGARWLYSATTLEAFSDALTLQLLGGMIFVPAFVGFAVEFAKVPLRRVTWVFALAWPALVISQMFLPMRGMYSDIQGLRQVSLPWVGELSLLDGGLTVLGWTHYLVLIGIVLFALGLGLYTWKKGSRRRGKMLLLTNGLLLLGMVNDAGVDAAGWPMPYLSEFALATLMVVISVVMVSRLLHYEKLEEKLHGSERRYRLLLESIPHATFISDQDGRIVFMSRQIQTIMGQTADQIRKLNPADIHQLLHPDDAAELMGKYQRFVTLGEPYACEFRLLHRDGVYRQVTGKGIGSYEEKGKRFGYGVFTDVTEWRQLEAQLRQSEKLQAIGQLAGGISHDFNNQLAGILSATELMSLADPNAPPSQRLIDVIRNAAERSADLTRQLLSFARKGKFLHVPVDINSLLTDVAEFLERSVDKRIHIETSLPGLPLLIGGDPSQIQNALLNLGINARDAQTAGGLIRFSLEQVTVDEGTAPPAPGLEPGNYVRIDVTDRGGGIDPQAASHIFEPFYTTKLEGQGTGLGLASVEGTVKSHGGAITFTSQAGTGTTFSLYFQEWSGHKSVELPNRNQSLEPWAGHGLKVLLVDDESLVLEMMGQLLCNEGFEVETCSGGKAALEKFEASPMYYSLLVTDLMMSEISGHLLQERARLLRPDLPILLISGFNVRGIIRDVRWDSRTAFLQKPFTRQALIESLAGLKPSA